MTTHISKYSTAYRPAGRSDLFACKGACLFCPPPLAFFNSLYNLSVAPLAAEIRFRSDKPVRRGSVMSPSAGATPYRNVRTAFCTLQIACRRTAGNPSHPANRRRRSSGALSHPVNHRPQPSGALLHPVNRRPQPSGDLLHPVKSLPQPAGRSFTPCKPPFAACRHILHVILKPNRYGIIQ
jgi:hypothetical protein